MVPTDVILQAVDCDVKQLPTVTTCPWEEDSCSLYLYSDQHGVWAYCPETGFSGNSINILEKTFNVSSPYEALAAAERSGLRVDKTRATREMFASHEYETASHRGINDFVSKCKENTRRRLCFIDLAEVMCAVPTADPRWWSAFGQYVGSCSKGELEQATGKRLKIKQYDLMFVPFYDLPGRVCQLRAYYLSRGRLESLDIKVGDSNQGGLFTLSDIRPDTDVIVAMTDPVKALRYQYYRTKFSSEQLPLVCYTNDIKTWPLFGSRVVFWNEDADVGLFQQAKKLPQSYVATCSSAVDVSKDADSGDVHAWYNHVLTTALPWHTALKERLINASREQSEAILTELSLSPDELGRLLVSCDQGERERLKRIIDGGNVELKCFIGDREVIQRDETWLHLTPKQHLVPVLNGTVELHRTVDYEGQGNYIAGTVKMYGREYAFQAPADKFLSNPFNWLRSYILRNEGEMLNMPSSWRSSLIDIALAFQGHPQLEHKKMNARVGWSEDKTCFRFPQFSMTRGLLDTELPEMPWDNIPGESISVAPVLLYTLKELTSDNMCNRYFWAFLTAASYNMTAMYYDRQIKYTCCFGNHAMVKMFANRLGLRVFTMKKDSGELDERIGQHDIPDVLILERGYHEAVRKLLSLGPRNVILSASPTVAAVLAGEFWQFLPMMDTMHGADPRLSVQNVFCAFVKQLQTTKMPSTPWDIAEYTAQLYHTWAQKRLFDDKTAENVPTISEAPLILRTESTVNRPLAPVEKFLYGVFTMIADNTAYLMSDGRRTSSKRGGHHRVEVDDTDLVKIDKTIFSEFVCGPGIKDVQDDATARNIAIESLPAAVCVHKDAWNEAYASWSDEIVRVS